MSTERGNATNRQLDRVLGIPMVLAQSIARRIKKRSRQKHWTPRKVCVFCPGAIGDLLLASTVLRTLQEQRDFELFLCVSPDNRAVLPLIQHGQQNLVLPIKRPLQALIELRRLYFDTLVDTHQWSRICAFISNFNLNTFTIGFRTPGQHRHFAYDVTVPHSAECHELLNYQRLLAPFNLLHSAMPPRLDTSVGQTAKSNTLSESPFAIIHPWASGFRHEYREWATENWVHVAKHLRSRGLVVFVTGSRSDEAKSRELCDLCQDTSVRSLAGYLSLSEVAWLLTQARVLVSVNTGIMHLGSTLATPTVAIHGPTNPNRWGPIGRNSVNLMPPNGDGGYLHLGFEYPKNPVNSMHTIRKEKVVDAVDSILSNSVEVISCQKK